MSIDTISVAPLPTFYPIHLRLDLTNYHLWKLQILSNVRAHGFDDILLGITAVPPKTISTSTDSSSSQVNPAYIQWLRRDQFLVSWLLSSISESMLGHVSRCTSSSEIWNVLETLSQSKTRIRYLRFQLLVTKKGDQSIEDYFLKKRSYADQLTAAGHEVTDDDLIVYILGGLSSEYEAVVDNLISRFSLLTLLEAQFSLQTHETRLQQLAKFNTISVHEVVPPSANMASRSAGSGQFNLRDGFFRGRGRGRFGRGKPECQICGKNNHIAAKCFKRFDTEFPGINLNAAQAHIANVQRITGNKNAANGFGQQCIR